MSDKTSVVQLADYIGEEEPCRIVINVEGNEWFKSLSPEGQAEQIEAALERIAATVYEKMA